MTVSTVYRTWLENTLNDLADNCRQYRDESPPEKTSMDYSTLQLAWDGLKIIVDKDNAYKNKDIIEFVRNHKAFSPNEVYLKYLNSLDVRFSTVLSRRVMTKAKK